MKQQGLKKGSLILLTATAISKIMGVIFKIPLTNLLGGEGMGFYSSAYAIYIPFYTVFSAGVPVAVTRLVANSCKVGDYCTARKIKKIATALYFCMGLLGMAVLLCLARTLAGKVANNPDCFLCAVMLAPSLAFCSLCEIEKSFYEGMKNMYPTAVSQVAESIAKTVFGLALSFAAVKIGIRQFEEFGSVFGLTALSYDDAYKKALPFAAAGAMLGQTLSEIAGLIALKIRVRFFSDGITSAEIKKSKVSKRNIHIIKELIFISTPLLFGALISAVSSFLDLSTVMSGLNSAVKNGGEHFLMLCEKMQREEIPNFLYGSYNGLTGTIISFVPIIAGLLSKSALPSVSSDFCTQNKTALKHNIERIMEATLFFSVPSGFMICALSKQILTFFYPNRALEITVSTLPLSVTGISAVFVSVMLPVFSMLCAVKKEKWVAILTATGTVIRLVLNIILIRIPEINILGAAIASCVSNSVTVFIAVKILISATDCNLKFKRIFGLAFAFSAVFATVIVAVKEISKSTLNENFSTLLAVFCGVLGYILLIFMAKVAKYADFKALFIKKPLKKVHF